MVVGPVAIFERVTGGYRRFGVLAALDYLPDGFSGLFGPFSVEACFCFAFRAGFRFPRRRLCFRGA